VFCIPKATLPPEVTLPPTGVMCGKGNSTTFCKNFQECIDDGDHQYCADYCAPDKCPPTMNCRLDIVNCIKEPCPPIAVCV
jgi:hypothetical protein